MSGEIRVAGLWIYPIKSCRGISLNEMAIGKTGPILDRQWMLVDQDSKFLTLRTEPKLSQIKPTFKKNELEIQFGHQTVSIPLHQELLHTETVTIWRDQVQAGVESNEINTQLSAFLNRSVKLVRYQQQSYRDLQTAGSTVVKETMFADSRPVLLLNQHSLDDLNKRLEAKALDESFIERFRGNILVTGLEAFSEDQIEKCQIGEVAFAYPKLCTRCPIITQEVSTGQVVSKETLMTLSEYRKVDGKKVMFGVYLTPTSLGKIQLGDICRIN